jgi:superfamily II DNA or RNA helicase
MQIQLSLVVIQVLGRIFNPNEYCNAWDFELLGEANCRDPIGERQSRSMQQVVHQRNDNKNCSHRRHQTVKTVSDLATQALETVDGLFLQNKKASEGACWGQLIPL